MKKIILRTKQIWIDERGAVLITVAILLLVLFGFAAFAIDFGYSYVVRNKLQNAADASSLAGASVLFSNNQLCLASERPYSCCTGNHTGSCEPGVVDVDNVTATAEALAAMNHSGGTDTTVNIEIGHYAFAPTWGTPGTFDAATPTDGQINQLSGWQTIAFDVLNNNTAFINAVRVTVTRGDIPRFFSRIWSSENDLRGAVRAIAYIGFAGTLGPGEVDQPIAICRQKIINDDDKTYTCSVGRMMNQNTQTSYWTDFDQANCGAADANAIRELTEVCSGNGTPIVFGQGMSTTNATATSVLSDILKCWREGLYDSNDDGNPDSPIDTNGDGIPDKPWKITLPVVDCPPPDNDNCRTVVGAVVVNVVWINDQGNDDEPTDKKVSENEGTPSTMSNPLPGGTDWNKSEHTECTVSDLDCWNKFVDVFNLEDGNATWQPSTLYFLPDCEEHPPTGGTSTNNFGIQARHPVLVK
jgi:Flp pilus assembly protein TadG